MRTLKKTGLILLLLVAVVTFVLMPLGCASQPEASLPIVLLTDFGAEDYRVSQLKGIIYNNNPAARLINGSHSVPAFNIPTGAFILNIAAKEFPADVVFVAVIAPYSQTETKYLVLTTEKNQIFVLPDNGLLTYVAGNMGVKTVYQVTNQELFDQPIAELSAERIQGKIGALMAGGYRARDVGPALPDYTTLDIQEPTIAGDKLLGTVVYIDHFGNGITNVSTATVAEFGVQPGAAVRVKIGESLVDAKYGTIYSDVAKGEEIVFVNNNLGVVQLSINLGNFAATHGVKAGTKIEIEK
jgi:S-adenosyl-L-methionine hydrolase (adenosine-forming)